MTHPLPSSPTPETALANATDAFAHWRATRERGREPTPAPLRALAVALLDTHRPASVARALAINPGALASWAADRSSSSSSPDPFVTLSPASGGSSEVFARAEPLDEPCAELVIRWPHGAQLVARGALPRPTLKAILSAAMTPPPSPS